MIKNIIIYTYFKTNISDFNLQFFINQELKKI